MKNGLNTKQQIGFPVMTIREPGYVFVYLSYENDSDNYVQFDDLHIKHTPTNVIQYNEYYPYGLQTSNSWTRDDHSNNYLYNAGNELNPVSGWYEMFYRGYDPALGRMLQVDPYAVMYASHTGYNYSVNNPVLFNDPTGGQAEYVPGMNYNTWRRTQYNSYELFVDQWQRGVDNHEGGNMFEAYISSIESIAYSMISDYDVTSVSDLDNIMFHVFTHTVCSYKDGTESIPISSSAGLISLGDALREGLFQNSHRHAHRAFGLAVNALSQIAKARAERHFLDQIIADKIKVKVSGSYRFFREGDKIVAYGKRRVNIRTGVIGPSQKYGILSHVYYDANHVIHDAYSNSNFTVYYDPINEGAITDFWVSDNYSEYGMIDNFRGGPALIFSGGGVDRLMFIFSSIEGRNNFVSEYFSLPFRVEYNSLLNRYGHE